MISSQVRKGQSKERRHSYSDLKEKKNFSLVSSLVEPGTRTPDRPGVMVGDHVVGCVDFCVCGLISPARVARVVDACLPVPGTVDPYLNRSELDVVGEM